MTHQKNQHWVPRYFFRVFNDEQESIHALLIKQGRIVFNAPIKGQCSKNNFYGSVEIEQALSKIEAEQAPIIRKTKKLVCSDSVHELTGEDRLKLLQAIFFQKSRTELELERSSASSGQIALHAFRKYVEHSPNIEDRDKILQHIDGGHVQITPDPHATILQSILSHFESLPLVCDLRMCIIRNTTNFPFIFADSPVVFYNTFYRDVSNRGVLGLQSPGLQVFLPIDSRTLIMLCDSHVYRILTPHRDVVTTSSRSDVSQLNVLQLHNCLNAVYFANAQSAEYVIDLWQAHSKSLTRIASDVSIRRGWLVDDNPVDEMVHLFRRHLNCRVDLSFVKCTPVKEKDFVFRRRCPELVREFNDAASKMITKGP